MQIHFYTCVFIYEHVHSFIIEYTDTSYYVYIPGFDADRVDLPFNVTLGEFLFIVDNQAPPITPSLPVRYIYIYTFLCMTV
jgi:hypothetical protein